MSRRLNALCALAICGLALSWPGVSPSRAEEKAAVPGDAFVTRVLPLLKTHCFGCHGADAQEGGVAYDDLTDDATALRRRSLWKRALARVAAGEMPPEGETPLSAGEKKTLVEWMSYASEYLDCNVRDPGPTIIRRLTRSEYDRTIRSLLGVDFKSAEAVGMPEEGVFEGFENTSAALTFSPAQMEKYLSAADRVLEDLYSARYNRQRQTVLFARPGKELSEDAAARQILERLARRAYRGPIEDSDVEPLLAIFAKARAQEAEFDDALRYAIKPILVAPRFLFRFEVGEPVDASQPGNVEQATRVTDHELAVRLSYFLWSSMPDDELFEVAGRGELRRPEVLRAQTLRMLKDARGRALVDDFAVQWLQLKKLDQARPQREFFPTFTNDLRRAMRDETLTFFDHLRTEDRSLLELLDADYTYVNADLAKHYQLTLPDNATSRDRRAAARTMQRVALRPEDHRGGLLGMGSVLAMTSHTFRTSPTLRGKYILEVMLGTPVPPPPPDAGMLKEDKRDKRKAAATFREQLAQHATQKSCIGCHKKLDPLGFALDNYDPIGGWRESTADLPLDVVGELPGGERFNGVAELKQLLMTRKDEFTRSMASKLLSYALGRELDYYDDCTIDEITERLKREDYRFSELILGVVESYPFQHRRLEAD